MKPLNNISNNSLVKEITRDNSSFFRLNNNQNKETKLPSSCRLDLLMNKQIKSRKLKLQRNSKNGLINNRRKNHSGWKKKSPAIFSIVLLAEGKIGFLM
jgi:hypothetical protein